MGHPVNKMQRLRAKWNFEVNVRVPRFQSINSARKLGKNRRREIDLYWDMINTHGKRRRIRELGHFLI